LDARLSDERRCFAGWNGCAMERALYTPSRLVELRDMLAWMEIAPNAPNALTLAVAKTGVSASASWRLAIVTAGSDALSGKCRFASFRSDGSLRRAYRGVELMLR
jgi:hypothetical protein